MGGRSPWGGTAAIVPENEGDGKPWGSIEELRKNTCRWRRAELSWHFGASCGPSEMTPQIFSRLGGAPIEIQAGGRAPCICKKAGQFFNLSGETRPACQPATSAHLPVLSI